MRASTESGSGKTISSPALFLAFIYYNFLTFISVFMVSGDAVLYGPNEITVTYLILMFIVSFASYNQMRY